MEVGIYDYSKNLDFGNIWTLVILTKHDVPENNLDCVWGVGGRFVDFFQEQCSY